MNFFAALSIFQIITPGVDVAPLPLRSTTYMLDSANVTVPSEQEVWQIKAPGLLENIQLRPNVNRTQVDTTRSYISLNSSNNPVQFTSLPNENPIQNGTEFLYSGNQLSQRLQYEKGKKVFTTEYQYSDGLLNKRITVDSLGPVDTTEYTYSNGNMIQIESHLRSGFFKAKYTYRGADTIESREYDVNGLASPTRLFWIMKDGNILKKDVYTQNKLTHRTLFEYSAVTNIMAGRTSKPTVWQFQGRDVFGAFGAFGASGTLDALGRHHRYLEGTGSGALPLRK